MSSTSNATSSSGSSPLRPELLIDENLALRSVLDTFRDAGYAVHTIDSLCGRTGVPDIEWIRTADDRGLAVITKDRRIQRHPHEREALSEGSLRVLCLTSGNLNSREIVQCFTDHMAKIDRLWSIDGPWLRRINKGGVYKGTL